MPKKNTRQPKKTTKIIIVIVLLIFVALATFFCLRILQKKSSPESGPSKQETQQETKQDNKEELKNQESSEIKKEDGIEIIDEKDPNNSEVITGSITRASKISNGNFRIIAMTDQALSEGNCELTFSNNKETLTSESEIVAHPNASTCTFDLTEELEPGEWNIIVKITTTKNRSGIIKDIVELK